MVSVTAVVGAQWGDEGKGKIIDELAAQADYVVRYQGGGNAGHRVVYDGGEFAFHQVPAGVLHPQTRGVIGNGVVIDPKGLLEELEALRLQGVNLDQIHISDRAHLVMPYHFLLDRLEEESRGADKIGTTLRGIGPAYVDKYARTGIRAGDLLDADQFRARLTSVLQQKNRIITAVYGQPPLSPDAICSEYLAYGEHLRPLITDTQTLLQDALAAGDALLLEGAHGALLDVDFGTYPFVTSSTTVAGYASTGAGLPARSIEQVIGVYKAYTTRVGSGPMPVELLNETGEALRERGREYGTTSGRPRRCGWFDAVAARYSARLNGLSSAVMMKLDVLDVFETLKLCTAYRLRGQIVRTPPANLLDLAACEPVYEELPGWQCETSRITNYADLPPAAKCYLDRLSELIETPISLISVGPSRGQTIYRESALIAQA
ncbi:MAG TPA: adenylosuccinate synthase [Ktedonobacterales bacterium]|jgi:adenylosuccinate synthase